MNSERCGMFRLLSWEEKLIVQGLPPNTGGKFHTDSLPDGFPKEVLDDENYTDDIWQRKQATAQNAMEWNSLPHGE